MICYSPFAEGALSSGVRQVASEKRAEAVQRLEEARHDVRCYLCLVLTTRIYDGVLPLWGRGTSSPPGTAQGRMPCGIAVGRLLLRVSQKVFFLCEPNDRQIDRRMEQQKDTTKKTKIDTVTNQPCRAGCVLASNFRRKEAPSPACVCRASSGPGGQ